MLIVKLVYMELWKECCIGGAQDEIVKSKMCIFSDGGESTPIFFFLKAVRSVTPFIL